MNQYTLLSIAGLVFTIGKHSALASQPAPVPTECAVERIIDGDTFVCDGERVRLLLVDAPERSQGSPAVQARNALSRLMGVGTTVRLETDVAERDRYHRLLAYVYSPDGRMVNLELARRGYAVSQVYPPNVRHRLAIGRAVASAKAAGRGLWSSDAFACEPVQHRRGQC